MQLNYLLDKLTNVIFKKYGFHHNKIITNWQDIAGDRLSQWTVPKKITYQNFNKKNELSSEYNKQGILHVEVANSGIAMELTYMEPIIIEKLATYFGYKAIIKLKFIQNPILLKKTEAEPIKAKNILTHAQKAALQETCKSIDDVELQTSLYDLGVSIYEQK